MQIHSPSVEHNGVTYKKICQRQEHHGEGSDPSYSPRRSEYDPYKQIAISKISGNMGQAFSDSIKTHLVESNRFQVVERARLQAGA